MATWDVSMRGTILSRTILFSYIAYRDSWIRMSHFQVEKRTIMIVLERFAILCDAAALDILMSCICKIKVIVI